MKTLALHINHFSSTAVFDEGKLIYFNQEERLSKKKYAGSIPFFCLEDIKKRIGKIDRLVVTGYNYSGCEEIYNYIKYLNLFTDSNKAYLNHFIKTHHLAHAFKALFSSKFNEAIIFVVDGRGSTYNLSNGTIGYETTSIYEFKHNNIFCKYKKIFTNNDDIKNLSVNIDVESNFFYNLTPMTITKNTEYDIVNYPDLGEFYTSITNNLGFNNGEEGKLMGLAAYGKYDENIYNNLKNWNYIDTARGFSKSFNLFKTHINNMTESKEDIAYNAQKLFEDEYLELVKNNIGEHKNVILTGGCALNVVNNYKLKKYFKDVNFYVEPMCGDEGNSIGIGQYYVTTQGRIPEVIDNICLGNQYEYNNITGKDVELKDVVNLLKDGHIVALYQKGCEAGPRALGNRSLLLNPTIKNGKDIMNTVKQRESFRPFACSILHEEMNEWFDMADLKESQYMMYAVQSKKSDIVPSIVHNDNTCRVQTVKENQNKVLYDLLKLFNKETNIPLLMNTSFNLAGETLVETPEDAIDVLNRSKLEYLYFADIKKLVYIKNNK